MLLTDRQTDRQSDIFIGLMHSKGLEFSALHLHI